MEHEEMTLCVVVFSADWWEHVCPRIRILGPAAEAGIHIVKGNEWHQGINHIFPERVSQGDIVLIQRDFPRYSDHYKRIISIAREQGKHIVYELDDLLTELPGDHPDLDHYLGARVAILRAVVDADAVIGSTKLICEYMRVWNRNVWHFPNYLHDEMWKFEKSPIKKLSAGDCKLVIGYMGGHSHQHDLEMIAPVLERTLKKYGEKIVIRFIGVKPPELIQKYGNVVFVHPGFVDYSEFISFFKRQSFDIVVAPLLINLFNRSKSHQKYLEYSALGVPGIYSDIPAYQSIVDHGKNGFLASKLNNWENYLELLIEDSVLREKMGNAAHHTVCDHWRLSQHANEWRSIIKDIQSLPINVDKSGVLPDVLEQLTSWYVEITDDSTKKKERLTNQVLSDILSGQGSGKFQDLINDLQKNLAQKDNEINLIKSQLTTLRQQLEDSQVARDEQQQTIHLFEEKTIDQQREIEQLTLKNDEFKHLFEDLQIRTLNQGQTIAQLRGQNQGLKETVDLHKKQMLEQGKTVLQLKGKQHELETTLNEIYISKGWKLLQFARRIRIWFIPIGSKREHRLRTLYRGLRVLRNEGLRVFFLRVKERLFNRDVQGGAHEKVFNLVACPGEFCPKPSISVLLIKKDTITSINENEVVAWYQCQTIQRLIQLVVWDRVSGKAYVYETEEHNWDAPDNAALLDYINTPYLCVVSQDLLAQNETYLEYNLIALHTEDLLFTVNLNGIYNWATDRIQDGYLPGNERDKLLRQVVRKEYVNHDFSINFDSWMRTHSQDVQVVGKIIKHTTETSDTENSLPFDQKLPGDKILFSNPYIIINPNNLPVNLSKVSRVIHPVDTVIPKTVVPDKRPTVLLVQTYLAVGGAERVALDMMKYLKEEIRFVVFSGEYMEIELGTTADLHRSITPFVYTIPDYLNWNLNYSHLIYLIERFQPETLYIANGVNWVYDALTWIKKEYPHLRLANQVYDYLEGWINRYDEHLVHYLDANIGVNHKIGQAFMNLGVPQERIYIIPNGLSVDSFDPDKYSQVQRNNLKKRLGLPINRKIITFISRVHPQKRPMDFVELARRLASDTSLYFLMVGDGPLAEAVESEVKRINLQNFKKLPFYKPSNDIYSISDIMVLPSEYEGMPMVILEAQAMGVPVVVTDVGNNREIIDLTQGGLVIPKIGDVTALYNGVLQVLKSPPDPIYMRQIVVDHFSMKRMGEEYRNALLGRQTDA